MPSAAIVWLSTDVPDYFSDAVIPVAGTRPDMPEGPLFSYRALRRAGAIRAEPMQELAAQKLQSLHHALVNYRPSSGKGGWKDRFGLGRRRTEPPQGLYLCGDVGRGKSFLMDLFFDTAPVEDRRRVHFHAFMLEVQERLHIARRRENKADPLSRVADALADEAWLICFDEFHVVNIADAMILGRLFERLLERGAVIVATSNSAPDALYRNGLQRDRFLPFIDLIKARLDVLDMGAGTDYRLARLAGRPVYHVPLGETSTAALDAAFAALADGSPAAPAELLVQGRTLTVPAAARGVARCGFAELCARPLGAADYLALARAYHTLILDGVPALTPGQRDIAKRFVVLVDALYEHRVKLIAAAEAPPQGLYPSGDTAFEFQRTASRLVEMQAADYLDAPHVGGSP